MKKILFTLSLLLALVANAQVPTGVWKSHPTFLGSQAVDMIETSQKVYMLSSGTVSAFDKTTGQVESYSKSNTLNDVSATGMYYNYDHNYLLVTFVNSNINVVYDDGRVIPVSDLSDVVMNSKKGINDVTFHGDSVLVATEFGYLIFNDQTWNVVESRNYETNVTSAAIVGPWLVLSAENAVVAAGDRRETISDFTFLSFDADAAKLRPVNDSKFFVLASGRVLLATFDGEEAQSCDATLLRSATAINLQPSPTGWIANCRANKVLLNIAAETFGVTPKTTTGTELYSSCPTGDGTPWILDDKGLYKQGTTNYSNPNAVSLRPGFRTPMLWLRYNPAEGNVYFQNAGDNILLDKTYQNQVNINRYDGSKWSYVVPRDMINLNLTDLTPIAFPRGIPNVYFTALRDNYNGGVCRVINDTLSQIVRNASAKETDKGWPDSIGRQIYPIPNALSPQLKFDSKGNLWIGSMRGTNGGHIACLPADKILKQPLLSEDFIDFAHPGVITASSFKHNSFAIGAGDVKVIAGGNNSLVAYMRNADDFSTSEAVRVDEWSMDDGTIFDPAKVTCLYADRDGRVWLGTPDGLINFDPRGAFEENFIAHMPTVGTVPLLKGEQVNCITQDSIGRMWFGTNAQGVVVTNPEGSEILAQFMGDNSDLPAPMIYDICIAGNSAFINTINGLVEFDMDGDDTPVEQVDYAKVGVSPVIIDNSAIGYVTISGLEAGSVVRITKRDGTLVAELTSAGAELNWEPYDETGQRLPIGIYQIFAAPNAESMPGQPQAEVRLIQ